MPPLPPDVERAFRRVRLHKRIVLTLARVKRAYPEHLARLCGVNAYRLDEAIHGRRPRYRPETCPLRLRLVKKGRDEHGDIFEVAPRGEEVARLAKMKRVRKF